MYYEEARKIMSNMLQIYNNNLKYNNDYALTADWLFCLSQWRLDIQKADTRFHEACYIVDNIVTLDSNNN